MKFNSSKLFSKSFILLLILILGVFFGIYINLFNLLYWIEGTDEAIQLERCEIKGTEVYFDYRLSADTTLYHGSLRSSFDCYELQSYKVRKVARFNSVWEQRFGFLGYLTMFIGLLISVYGSYHFFWMLINGEE